MAEIYGGDQIGDQTDTQEFFIHIRVQQRNGKKRVTSVSGLTEMYPMIDLPKVLRYLKKEYNCNGALAQSEDGNSIIILAGDHRKSIMEFLIQEELATKSQIKVHGI